MLNFTGSTKKRVVNLGDSRGAGTRPFLEKARHDRLAREKERLRAASAAVIQAHVRRFLVLHAAARHILDAWPAAPTDGAWDRWCAQACFAVRFGPAPAIASVVSTVAATIASGPPALSEYNTAQLVRTASAALGRTPSCAAAVDMLAALTSRYRVPEKYPSALGPAIGRLSRAMDDRNGRQVAAVVFRLACGATVGPFLHFLARVPRKYLSAENNAALESCLQHPDASAALRALGVPEQINVLLSVLRVRPPHLTRATFLVHADIFGATNCLISVQPGTARPEWVSQTNTVTVNSEDWDLLSSLSSAEYISHAVRGPTQNTAVHFLCSLSSVFPQSRLKISMAITLNPEMCSAILDSVTQNTVYHALLEAENGPDMLTSVHLANFSKPQHDGFWSLLYTYEQTLSYWLIVSNDTESFQAGAFSVDKIQSFCRALKAWCLTAIYQQLPANHWRLAAVNKISVQLLNQLYMKNLRLKFLPETFWKLKTLRFNTASMIESLLQESDSDESDDDMDIDSAPASKSRVLTDVPFFIEFTERVKVFQGLIEHDRRQQDSSYLFSSFEDSRLEAEIRRENALEDAYDAFNSGVDFRKKLSITFVNDYGAEAGIDGGGLTKELLNLALAQGCSPKNPLRLFKETSNNGLYPNEDIYLKAEKRIGLSEQENRLKHLRFMGSLLGKCLYENVLIDISFAPFFLSKFRVTQNHSKNSVEDLVYLDSELHRNLNKLQGMSAKEVDSLELNFTINEIVDGDTHTFDLLPPNREREPVTAGNILNYIHKMATFKLNQSLGLQTKFFLEGMFALIRPKWLSIFDPFELQILISGGHDIDLDDWKANVNYGGFWETDATILNFWEVVAEMTPAERCDLLKFVTSVSRAPLLGFGELNPKFAINRSLSIDRLPTASTCVNLLKLPDYKDKAMIREKLLYSISSNSGFDLS